jgi:hypothetical protein
VKTPRVIRQTHLLLTPGQVGLALLAWVALLGVAALVYFAWLEGMALWRWVGWMLWGMRG